MDASSPIKTAKTKTKKTTDKAVIKSTITPPNLPILEIQITGDAPYCQHKFGEKMRRKMMDTQEAGSTAKSKRVREPKDFDDVYEQAIHYSSEGWIGIPAAAFRSAMIDACRLTQMVMTKAKLAVFIVPDGIDADDGQPLVRIIGEPEQHIGYVRLSNGSADITARPLWREWAVTLHIKYDADQFTSDDVINLLLRAGQQVGIGEGRPNSRKSHGMGWGTFTLDSA